MAEVVERSGAAESGAGFAAALRRFRVAAGLTQEALAERAGVSARAVSDLERDSGRTPRAATVTLLATALGLSDADTHVLRAAARGHEAESKPNGPHTLRTELPRFLTPLIGRSAEIDVVAHLLNTPGRQLVTLTGPGGVGKTRVAVATADRLGDAMFVDLASVREPGLVLPAIAQRLGADDASRLVAVLRSAPRLLVLDNLEQVVAVGEGLVELLQGCPQVRILATSRIPFRVRGEHEFRLAPLKTPAPDDDPATAAAYQLFCDRADAVGAGPVAGEEAAVAAITRRLGGLPLALELAAARLGVLGPDELLAQLDRTLAVLVDGPVDLPDRQRTMRATVAWSEALLSEAGQVAFRRMAVCAGGGSLTDLAAVCASSPDAIAEVVRANLASAERSGGTRWITMLEPVREYAWDQLVAADDVADTARRLVEVVVDTWSSAGTNTGRNDLANLRTAITWALESGESDRAHELLAASVEGLLRLGALEEGHRFATTIHALPPAGDPMVAALSALGALRLAVAMWDTPTAAQLGDRAVELADATGDQLLAARAIIARGWQHRNNNEYAVAAADFTVALDRVAAYGSGASDPAADRVRLTALHGLTYVTLFLGDFAQGRRINDEAGELAERLADEHARAQHLMMRAWLDSHAGRFRQAADVGAQAVDVFRRLGDRVKLAEALRTHGDCLSYMPDTLIRARDMLEESRLIYLERGEESIAGQVEAQSAYCYWQLGERAEARRRINGGLEHGRRFGDLWAVAMCTTLLGHFELVDGDREVARVLLHEGADAFTVIGNPLYVRWSHEGLAALAMADGDLATARDQLVIADRLRDELPSRTGPIDAGLMARTRSALETPRGR
ncbi:MAG: helix-turn-helix domain-containing protein [Propionibacteriaceae bacterium]|nr:helix-turn-helix domain-containing protein [Propionibacteriaceae bacterium]